jgi:hypothetical protein
MTGEITWRRNAPKARTSETGKKSSKADTNSGSWDSGNPASNPGMEGFRVKPRLAITHARSPARVVKCRLRNGRICAQQGLLFSFLPARSRIGDGPVWGKIATGMEDRRRTLLIFPLWSGRTVPRALCSGEDLAGLIATSGDETTSPRHEIAVGTLKCGGIGQHS